MSHTLFSLRREKEKKGPWASAEDTDDELTSSSGRIVDVNCYYIIFPSAEPGVSHHWLTAVHKQSWPLLYSHSICLKGVEEAPLFQIQPEHLRTEKGKGWALSPDMGRTNMKACQNNKVPSNSRRAYKIEVTGGVVVRKVPPKLGNARLVVVSVLGVELHIAVSVQKHQLWHKGNVNASVPKQAIHLNF